MESINLTSGYRIIFHYQWGNWFHDKTQTPKSAGARVPTLVLFTQGLYPRTCADLISCGSKSPGKRHMLYPSQLVKSLCAQIVDTEGPTVSLLFFFFNLPIGGHIQFKPAGSKGQPYVQMEWNSVSLRVISASPCPLQHLSRW